MKKILFDKKLYRWLKLKLGLFLGLMIAIILIELKFLENGLKPSHKVLTNLVVYPFFFLGNFIMMKFLRYGILMKLSLYFAFLYNFLVLIFYALLLNFNPDTNYNFTLVARGILIAIIDIFQIYPLMKAFYNAIAHPRTAANFIACMLVFGILANFLPVVIGIGISHFIGVHILVCTFIILQFIYILFNIDNAKKCDEVSAEEYKEVLGKIYDF